VLESWSFAGEIKHKEGKKEGRKEERKEGRREGRKEGMFDIYCGKYYSVNLQTMDPGPYLSGK